MATPVQARRQNPRAPDAPPLHTRSGNKHHAIHGPPTVRRTREQVEADEAAARVAHDEAERRKQAALARVAATEDENQEEDKRRRELAKAGARERTVPVQQPASSHKSVASDEDVDMRSLDDGSGSGSEDLKMSRPKRRRNQARAPAPTFKHCVKPRIRTGTPDVGGGGKRKAGKDDGLKTSKRPKVVLKKAGLAPPVPAKRQPATSPTQLEDGDSMFQPGGPALEDGHEGIEHPARKGPSKGLPKIDSVKISQKQLRGGGGKWTIAHLPPNAEPLFTRVFIPLTKEQISISESDPWLNLGVADMQTVIDRVYPNEGFIVKPKEAWFHLVHYRAVDYRRGFLDQAKKAFELQLESGREAIAEYEAKAAAKAKQDINGEDEGDEDADEGHGLIPVDTPAGVADLVEYFLTSSGDGHSKAFHWNKWDESQESCTGLFESFLIKYTFTFHLMFLDTIPHEYRQSSKPPYGALLLSIQAVECVLQRWTTGIYVAPPKGHKYEFSTDNWGDAVETIGKQRRKIRRATKYLKTLQAWTEDEWEGYIESAAAFKVTKNRCSHSRSSSRVSSNAPEELEDEEEEQFVISRR
ncbi:hypothetical protein MIND_01245800 [Mycena indigotica]|uniref:Uncharacterized protein n=1 Tax=Mycena indigotica TaxID=2126181 RepID=A0A8H6S4Q1_9AGAR|nr:uncharacterized protein MIND_01245600 [Mycena indigotica]XP_037214912.1 uncharacterized protein MIND_01245800 [Mycena indigotica]KAF7292183.1 hypothetical protein MIND_01245600 [Mycena indigotica]KAF7292185.1 hypothetical protein MIND_01245800 [Mycena indigotica]